MTGKELEKQKIQEAFEDKKIGLALSGGGYRAAVFHLGMISYMAENGLLERVAHISTVSGGSLIMGLVYKLNNYKWPTSKEFLDNVLKQAIWFLGEKTLLEVDSKVSAAIGAITNGRYAAHEEIVMKLKNEWKLDRNIQTLDDYPKWTINTTTGETGKSWRIEKEKMGDYTIGEIKNPSINLAKAIAASAGFPFAIGPLVLDLTQYKYTPRKGKEKRKKISLYDGGLYDNLGTEVFFGGNFSKFPKSIDFLIVSDASKPLEKKEDMYSFGRWDKLEQISDITTEQMRSLRVRMFHRLIYQKDEPNLGIHIRIGDTELGLEKEAKCAKEIKTDLKALSKRESDCLTYNGFDAALKKFEKYCEDIHDEFDFG